MAISASCWMNSGKEKRVDKGLLGWIIFGLVIVSMLVLDLRRKVHEIKLKEALLWSAVWIGLALLFNVGVFIFKGHDAALKFFTGYLLEESLSIDNLFVFILIFSFFRVPAVYEHEVLFWGIVGAIVMRAFFIAAGVTLLHHFHWVIYIFGAILVLTGFKLISGKGKKMDPSKNPVIKIFRRFMPLTEEYHGGKFFIRKNGKLFATPLFIVLLVIESTDVVFAIDSIPAILGITTDPFIVYTSNIFAILGLRSLYFSLAGVMKLFAYLNYGLAVILIFIGVKMLISEYVKIPIALALGVIAGVLLTTIVASILWPPKGKGHS